MEEILGVKIVEASNLDTEVGHSAGSIKERVKSLHDFFRRKDIHAIMSFWGGFNTHQILEYIDYDLIKKHPKILIGYSDTTTLLSAITYRTGLVTFNGPAVTTFAKPIVPQATLDSFISLLCEGVKDYIYPISKEFSDNQWFLDDQMIFSPNAGLKVFQSGEARGEIVGGNVGTLLLLAGTEFLPAMKGKILFVEDDEAENTRTIDRYFTQLRHMKVFNQISGMVVGRFPRCVGLKENDSLEMILKDALAGFKIPVITGFDMGHTDPLHTIPLGGICEMNTRKEEIKILGAVVK